MADGGGVIPAWTIERPVVRGAGLVGMINNPRSHGHGRRGAEADDMAAREAGVVVVEPDTRAALLDALRMFAELDVRLVVVRGGDGTLRDVLTALPFAYGGNPPELALLPSGNTNLAARALRLGGLERNALHRLLAAVRGEPGAPALRRVDCPVLEVRWPAEARRRPVRGLLLGAAAFSDGKKLADGAVHGRGIHNGLAVALTVAVSVLMSLFGRGPSVRGEPMTLQPDGQTLSGAAERQFLLLVTALPRLMLGLWPFWGEGKGALSWLTVSAPTRKLWAMLPLALLRRARRLLRSHGIRSARADRIRLRLSEPFVLDGDFFEPGPDGVLLSSPARARFVTTHP
jgi:hypothetical protein